MDNTITPESAGVCGQSSNSADNMRTHHRPWHICSNPDCQVHVTHYQGEHPLCCLLPEPANPCVLPGEYGEPWTYAEGAESDEEGWWHRYAMITNRYEHTMCKDRHLDDNIVDEWHRIVACVNACAGMADPAAEIAAMRGAIREAHRFIRDIVKNHECGWDVDAHGESILTKLQPFIKEP